MTFLVECGAPLHAVNTSLIVFGEEISERESAVHFEKIQRVCSLPDV